MSGLPPVDVVVLSLDRRRDVNECVDSVLDQDHPDVRLWVIDQGSGSETLASLRQRAGKGRFQLREAGRIGIAAGRNLGYRLGRAPVIVSLDNDAVLGDRDVLRRAVSGLEAQGNLGALAFAVHDYYRGGPDMSCWVYPWPAETHFDRSFTTARFCGGAHAILRTAFEATGGYDEEIFFFGEELDLSYALVAGGYRIEYRPDIIVRHKASPERRIDWDSGRFYHNARNMLYINQKHFGGTWMKYQYACGYLLKGLINGVPASAWRGVRDGLRLARKGAEPPLLDPAARAYIQKFELGPRGGIWRRFRREVALRMRPTAAR